jgi:hemerythrin-like domain-containing protein
VSTIATRNSEQLLAEDHHALDKLLNALVAAIDENDLATTFARLDLFWARLAMHIRAENLRLFPALLKAVDNDPDDQGTRNLDPMVARQAIDRLHSDHDFFMGELAAAVKIMRESMPISTRENETLDQVRQIVVAVNKRLESHNQLEEELVYRLPAKLLSTDEQSELAASIRRELENLPPRFTTDQ